MPTKKIRVADFTTHFPGPLASHVLVGLGAEVIKFENPKHGDGNRELRPFVSGESLFHTFFSGGVRSLAVNRRSEAWPTIVSSAVKWADAVLVGDRIDVLRDRGLDFETISAANPEIVYCMLPAYGNIGPWSKWPAHGQSIDFAAGHWPSEFEESESASTPADWRAVGTGATGVFAALAVMHGIHQRDAGEAPVCLEVSLWASAVWWQWRDYIVEANTSEPWQGLSDLGPRYGVYRASDGGLLQVAPIERKFWEAFCDIVGLPLEVRSRGEWDASRMDEGTSYPEERALIQERIATRDRDVWLRLLGAAGIPAAPLLTRREVIESDHAGAQEMFQEVRSRRIEGKTFRVPRVPIRNLTDAETSPQILDAAPDIGEDTQSVLEEFGLMHLKDSLG